MRRYNVGSSAFLSTSFHRNRRQRQVRNFSANPCPIDPPRHAQCPPSDHLRTARWRFTHLLHAPVKNDHTVAHCERVYAQMVVSGLSGDTYLANLMIKLVGRSEDAGMEYARKVFDKMPDRNLVSWATMISVYNGRGLSEDAVLVFLECLRRSEESVNEFILAGVVRGCTQLGGADQGVQVHGFVVKSGFDQDVYVGTSLTDFYSKQGDIDRARLIFDGLEVKSTVSWTTIISGYVKCGKGHEALELFHRLGETGVLPDMYIVSSVLSACSTLKFLAGGEQVHCYGIRRGLDSDPSVTNLGKHAGEMAIRCDPNDSASYVLLSNVLAADGKWADARKVRERMDLSGTVKEPGCSWIESGDKVDVFIARDRAHTDSDTIYSMLHNLILQITESVNVPENDAGLESWK
uniref:Pentatricopeptide repeat-containing protein n=1 Tax=Kalanchoe fedtschenkoi TaxID=63787 RepID=A0A7N0V1Z7_KALFE